MRFCLPGHEGQDWRLALGDWQRRVTGRSRELQLDLRVPEVTGGLYQVAFGRKEKFN